MYLKNYGHATLSIEKNGKPILITDPWLIGSCYWRSWWLQHYPNENDLETLSETENIFLSHEHWDHAHYPSLKKYFSKKNIFIPTLNSKKLRDSLIELNFKVTEIEPNKWNKFEEIQILSITTYNDDSIILFRYGNYLILNNNDAKPTKQIAKQIYEFKEKNKLKLIILQSYSSASIVNSFRDKENKTVLIKSKKDYVNYIKNICNNLKANYFIPFASHAIFSRPDSSWANLHKVNYEDLEKNWDVNTKLLKSYTTFDLINDKYFSDVKIYNKSSNMEKLSISEYNSNSEYKYEISDLNNFSNITKPVKYFLMILYPLGLNFKFGDRYFVYSFLNNSFKEIDNIPSSYFEMPVKIFCESCKNYNFTDTGTSFVLKIFVKRKMDIYRSYLLFVFLTYSEKGYFSNFKMFQKQIGLVIKNFFPNKISL